MRPSFEIRVECYAGFKADEKPLRFSLGGRVYEVVDVVDQWRGPQDTWFQVKAGDGNTYVLRHAESGQTDRWTLESFRRG